MEATESNSGLQLPTPIYHVAFLHDKLEKRVEDRYLIDLAVLLKKHGHKVVIYASEFDPNNCLDEVHPLTGEIPVVYSGWWLPKSFKCLRSFAMSLRIMLFPGLCRPKFVFVDVHPFALFMLSKFSSMKTLYVEQFALLKHADFYTDYMQLMTTLSCVKCLKYAHAVVTQSACLAEIFQRSYPRVKATIKPIAPLVDCGVWLEGPVEIDRIVPDVQRDDCLFVVFGSYAKRADFRLALDAFEQLLLLLEDDAKPKLHLVIAGICGENSFEQRFNYNELTETTKDKYFASQVTFLRQLPVVHKRTLIERSRAVLYPAKHDPFPETIVAAMSLRKPVITTNTGFAKSVLTHRITGILINADANVFAAAMYKIMMNPAVERFIGDMAYDVYRRQFSSNGIYKKLNGLFKSFADGESDAVKPE